MPRRLGLALAAATTIGCGGGSTAPAPTQPGCEGLGLFSVTLERGTIVIGETTRGTVIARGCGGQVVSIAALKWESSAPTVAAIGFEGAIIGESVGSAQITARLGSSAASVPLVVVEPPLPPPGPPGSMAVRLFSPTLGAVVDDSVRVLASVLPQGHPLSRVAGTIGPKEFPLQVIYVGFSRQELWEARVRVNDLAAGNYRVVVRAFDPAGASAADSVIFERRLLNTGGTGTGPSGNKLLAPRPDSIRGR